jgi:diguanylate cyclase (GGDEF)-like protein
MHTSDYLYSLQSKVRRASTPIETAEALADLAFAEMRMGQSSSANAKLAELADLAQRLALPEIAATHAYLQGVFEFYVGHTTISITHFLNARRMARLANAARIEARSLAALCPALSAIGAYSDAIDAAEQALEIASTVGDDRAVMTARISLANLHADRQDGDAALAQLALAEPVLARLGDPLTSSSFDGSRVNALIVNARRLMADPTEENRKTVEATLKLCEIVAKAADETAHQKAQIYSWTSLGHGYHLLGDTQRALMAVDRAISIGKQSSLKESLASAYHVKAKLLIHMERYPEAAKLLMDASEDTSATSYLALQEDVEATRVTCFEKMGDIAAALEASKTQTRLLIEQRTKERANLDALRKAKREFADAQRAMVAANKHAEQMGKMQAQLMEDTQKFKRISFEDALTNLKNRRYFDLRFPDLLEHHQTANTPLSMAIIDIDAFKSINDRFGHLVGDAVLQDVAAELLSHTQKPGTPNEVCRLGGDEFALFLPGASLAAAHLICEAVRQQFATSRAALQYGATLSIGLAEWSHQEDTTAFLTRADQKLFEAKRKGRDRVAL